MHAVILAGGKGIRLGKLTINNPKPLIKIGNKPLLEHQINLLIDNGIKNIWILSGYLGEKIEKFAGDGSKWDAKINHIIEQKPLGTAGALKQLEDRIKKNFLLLSGDVILDMDLKKLIKFHNSKVEKIATIVVHPNDHPIDSDLVEVNENCRVTSFFIRKNKQSFSSNKTQSKNIFFRNLANAGVSILSPKTFNYIKRGKFSDLEKNIFPLILKNKEKIFAYNTPEYIKDMGTIKRLNMVRRDYKNGKIAKLNLKHKRKAIFLDRDGVINRDIPFLSRIDDFKLLPHTATAIKTINKTDYLSIIITNQALMSMGKLSPEQLNKIHKKLESELGKKGAWIDFIFYCPHYPKKGFAGEIEELKIKCSCRKPKTGLIGKAARKFNIDILESFYIGDTIIDAKTAKNAGLSFIGVKTGRASNQRNIVNFEGYILKNNLLEAVKFINSQKN